MSFACDYHFDALALSLSSIPSNIFAIKSSLQVLAFQAKAILVYSYLCFAFDLLN